MVKAEPSFPFDWIAPGEYTYCYCCWCLVDKPASRCQKCITSAKAVILDKNSPLEPQLEEISQRLFVVDEVHNKLIAERDALAEKRRSEGVNPLFWMEKK
jgi:hypothetical protein